MGTIISDLTKSRPHSYPFHFIRTSEFHRTDSPLDDGEMDKLIARIKSEMVQVSDNIDTKINFHF